MGSDKRKRQKHVVQERKNARRLEKQADPTSAAEALKRSVPKKTTPQEVDESLELDAKLLRFGWSAIRIAKLSVAQKHEQLRRYCVLGIKEKD
jgi:hypothetical protein